MSDPLRIGLVVEGPTDQIVIEAVLAAVLGGRDRIVTRLQPEDSEAFGERGTGWPGVYKWCRQSAAQGHGRISENKLLLHYDLLIIHLDADVADLDYRSGNIDADPTDLPLPCARPCPPPTATTDELRRVLLSWCGEPVVPGTTVVCMPSKSTEAWVVASLFPADRELLRAQPFDCFANPEGRLGQQPKKQRIRKTVIDYRSRQSELASQWPRIAGPDGLIEATRFDGELRAALVRL